MSPLPTPVQRVTVLLVDDEASVRELIIELLEADGYEVLSAANPVQAIEAAERHHGVIHLLLTDLLMPGMSGRDLAQRVKERRPDICILYMSGFTEEALAPGQDLEAGALLISKPFTADSFSRKIREALGTNPREQG